MTTAHRPTWKAAVGQANEGGWFAGGASTAQKSALDAPAHTKLKVRRSHQLAYSKDDLLRKSLLELEQAEVQKASSLPRKPINPIIEERAKVKLLKQTAEVDVLRIKDKYDDSDIDDDDDDDQNSNPNGNNNGNDDSSTDLDDYNDDSDSDDDDDDDEDDEIALKAELDKIRAEREEMKRKEDDIIASEEKSKLEADALLSNPLLHINDNNNNNGNGRLKRRWNDDVVFRNQAANEPEMKKRFINDTVRNDFHKRFLQKFIR